jgi:hypothetical protein
MQTRKLRPRLDSQVLKLSVRRWSVTDEVRVVNEEIGVIRGDGGVVRGLVMGLRKTQTEEDHIDLSSFSRASRHLSGPSRE